MTGMQYRLRTLLIVLALGPPVLSGLWLAWPTIAVVAAQLLGFLAFVAVLVAAGVGCAMGLASVVDAAIDPWEKPKP